MQGVKGSNPLSSTAKYQGKRSARATPAGRRTPAKPQFGRLISRQHRAPPGNLNARPISSDLSVATPGPGGGLPSPTRSTTRGRSDRRYGPRADYPVAGAWAARACGIAVTWVGRPAPRWPGQLAPVRAAEPDGCRGGAALASQASVLSDRPHVLVELSVLVRVHRSNECRACAALVHSDLDLTAVRGLPGRVDG